MKKGIIHFHSTFSYDGLNTITSIIKFVNKYKLDFIVLTDHDTIEGSKKLQEELKKNNLEIEVPIAAEYKTDFGDVIALFIKKEIESRNFKEFVKEVREQNGILILPHPYDGHININEISKCVDAIEVFNSRSSTFNNFKSYVLAKKLKKPMVWASDSHVPWSMKNVLLTFSEKLSLRNAIMNDELIPLKANKSSSWDLVFSQIKKGIVTKNLKLIIRIILSLPIRILARENKIFQNKSIKIN